MTDYSLQNTELAGKIEHFSINTRELRIVAVAYGDYSVGDINIYLYSDDKDDPVATFQLVPDGSYYERIIPLDDDEYYILQPGKLYYAKCKVSFAGYDIVEHNAETDIVYTSKYNKSLKAIFTDIADATQEILRTGNGFYGERTLPNIVRNLNDIDHSYNIDLPDNYDKDYNTCIKTLADVIRARRFATAKFTLPEMPAQIRQINGKGDQEREYLIGNRIKNTTHTECVANYSYYNWNLYPGQVVYVNVPSQNSLEKAIVMKSDNRVWVDDDGGYYDNYSVITISTPHFVYTKDSRYSSPTVSGTVVTNPNTPFSVYKDTLNYWTTIECYVDLYKESGTYDPVEVYLYFSDWGSDKIKFPTSIDLRVEWAYDGSTGTGSVRIDSEYDSYYGTANVTQSSSSSSGDPVLRSIWGTITGNFGGTVQTIDINNYY